MKNAVKGKKTQEMEQPRWSNYFGMYTTNPRQMDIMNWFFLLHFIAWGSLFHKLHADPVSDRQKVTKVAPQINVNRFVLKF